MTRRRFLSTLAIILGSSALIGSRAFSKSKTDSSSTAGDEDPETKWKNLTPTEQADLRQRWQKYQDLSFQEQRQLKQAWQRFQALPKSQQNEIRKNLKKFAALPQNVQSAIRVQWQRWGMSYERRLQIRSHYRKTHGY